MNAESNDGGDIDEQLSLQEQTSRVRACRCVSGSFEALDRRIPNIVFSTPVITSYGAESGLFNPGISRFTVSVTIAFPVAVGDIRYDQSEHSIYVRE